MRRNTSPLPTKFLLPRLLALAALAASAAFTAQATTIDFDSTSGQITDQYAAQGVIFNGFLTESAYFSGAIDTVSAPNWLDVFDTGTMGGNRLSEAVIDFVDPGGSGNPYVTDSVSITANGLVAGLDPGNRLDGFELSAFDAAGNQVGSTLTVNRADNTTGRLTVTLTFTGSIHELDFTRLYDPDQVAAANPIDNLVFGDLSAPGSTPEPATFVLFGFASTALWAMRSRIAR